MAMTSANPTIKMVGRILDAITSDTGALKTKESPQVSLKQAFEIGERTGHTMPDPSISG